MREAENTPANIDKISILATLQGEARDMGDYVERSLRAADIWKQLDVPQERINSASGRWLATQMRRLGWERKVTRGYTEYVRRD